MLERSLNSKLGNASVQALDGCLSKEKSAEIEIHRGSGRRTGCRSEQIVGNIWEVGCKADEDGC